MPNWKYCLCHEWLQERVTWEDFLVLPDDPDKDEQALWLTFSTLGDGPESPLDPDSIAFYERCFKLLDGRKYWVRTPEEPPLGDADLLINGLDFSKEELVEWIRVWLNENGLSVDDLIEAPLSEFRNRSSHADALLGLQEAFPPEDEE